MRQQNCWLHRILTSCSLTINLIQNQSAVIKKNMIRTEWWILPLLMQIKKVTLCSFQCVFVWHCCAYRMRQKNQPLVLGTTDGGWHSHKPSQTYLLKYPNTIRYLSLLMATLAHAPQLRKMFSKIEQIFIWSHHHHTSARRHHGTRIIYNTIIYNTLQYIYHIYIYTIHK